MATFVIFVLAVALYIAFLLWSLAPLVRRPRRQWAGWLRVIFGLLLLGANLSPLLMLPIQLPIYSFNRQAGSWFTAVALFPRTIPIYVRNIQARARATATVIDVTYPLTISGIRYALVVRTGCTTRKMVDIDHGALQFFENFPTASGGALIARDANMTLALDQSPLICSMTPLSRLHPGPLSDYRRPGAPLRVYVVRGEADNTQIYELHFHSGAVVVDDIVLQPPQIVHVDHVPASDAVSLDALWPMRRPGESGYDELAIIDAYRRLPAGMNACVEFVFASVDSKTKAPKISRTHKTIFRGIPVEQRSAYCRDVLARHIPQPSASRLTPAGG